MIPSFGSRLFLRIGLLGGSFNPAHAAHREISLIALHRLKLDQVWWLVSPQNPLKQSDGMAPLAQRLAGAKATASHPRIVVTAVEDRLDTRYTADTLEELKRHYPNMRFVWLMGADNLNQIRHWDRWRDIARAMPIAVLDRPGHNLTAPQSLAARWLAQWRLPQHEAAALADKRPPRFVLLKSKLNPLSATALRQARRSKAIIPPY